MCAAKSIYRYWFEISWWICTENRNDFQIYTLATVFLCMHIDHLWFWTVDWLNIIAWRPLEFFSLLNVSLAYFPELFSLVLLVWILILIHHPTPSNSDWPLLPLLLSWGGSRLWYRTGSLQMFPLDILWGQSSACCDSEACLIYGPDMFTTARMVRRIRA